MNLLVSKWGVNNTTDAVAGTDDIIPEGGLQYWALVAATLSITSSSVNDVAAGTGARTLMVEGLDDSYNIVQESITLNGLTPVTSLFQYLRVNRAYVITAGTVEKNDGDITLSDGVGVMAFIEASAGQTTKATYTVPASILRPKISLITGQVQEKTANNAQCRIVTRSVGGAWRSRYNMNFVTTDPFVIAGVGILDISLKPRDDVRVYAYDGSANGLSVGAGFSIVY